MKGNKLMESKVKEVFMQNHIEDENLVNELWDKVGKKEELTELEHKYLIYCYHLEEWRAGLL